MTQSSDIERYRRNLRDELDGAALYAALADAESDSVRKDLFRQLSRAEASHAKVWSEKLRAAGIDVVPSAPSLRTRILARLAPMFGPHFVLPAIAAAERARRNRAGAGSGAERAGADLSGERPR